MGLKTPSNIQLFVGLSRVKSRELREQWHGWCLAYNGSVWVNPDGNRIVAYLYENGSERNLNLNNVAGDWNDNYRFLVRRKTFYSPHYWGVSF